jgi:hypothetical protein
VEVADGRLARARTVSPSTAAASTTGLHLRPDPHAAVRQQPDAPAMIANTTTSSPATTGAEVSASCSPSHRSSIPMLMRGRRSMMAGARAVSMPFLEGVLPE